MALTIWVTSPMNMWIHKNAETECIEVEHTQMKLFIIHSGSKHMFLQAFYMFITFINRKYDCRSKIGKIAYLIKNSFCNQLCRCNIPPNHRPACSLTSQQRCHPWAGHDSPSNKEQAGLHIAKDIQNTAKPTQLGLSCHQQDNQANMVRFIRPSRSLGKANC